MACAILRLVVVHAFEFLVLFFAIPTLFAYTRHRIPAIPGLWLIAGYCLFFLLRNPNFQRDQLWNPGPIWQSLPTILAPFLFAVTVGVVLIRRYVRGLFFHLVRTNPGLWGLIMVAYPILSVYPQGIIYRAFIFDRYKDLFPNPVLMIFASAFAFTYVHIVFRNNLALILTCLGGFLFAIRYWLTASLFVSSFEHALYGCAIFTLGVGESFYHAAVRRSRSGALAA